MGSLLPRLNSQLLLLSLMRLSHRDGRDPEAHTKDPGLGARIATIRDTLSQRLKERDGLVTETSHTLAHIRLLCDDPRLAAFPDILAELRHLAESLGRLPQENYSAQSGNPVSARAL